MKTRILLWLLLLLSGSAWAQLSIKESFEANSGDYGYTAAFSNTPAAQVYFTRTTNPKSGFGNPVVQPTGVDQSYFWAAEAARDFNRTLPPATITLNAIPNAENYNNIKVNILVTDPRRTTTGTNTSQALTTEHLRIQYAYSPSNSIPADAAFQTAGEFTGINPSGGSLWYQFVNGVNTGRNLVENFDNFEFPIISSGSGFLFVRVQVDVASSGRELGFDNIRVTGDGAIVQRPTLTTTNTGSVAYAEAASSQAIFTSLTADNPAGTTLDGAKVVFTSGRVAAQDELTYTIPSGSGITFDAGNSTNGTLAFTGTSSEANYRDLLLSVRYRNTSSTAARGGTRTLAFTVNSGASSSLQLTRDVVVTATLNAATGLPFTEDFEDDGEGTTYATNSVPAPPQGFVRLTGPPGATYGSSTVFGLIQGSGYFYGRGTKEFLPMSSNGLPTAGNNIATPQGGVLQLAPINTTGFTDLHFKLKAAAAGNFFTDDFLRFSYNLNNGAGWQPFPNGNFTTPSGQTGALRRDASATGQALTSNMQDVDITLPAAVTGTNVSFRVEVGDNGGEEIAFDYIQVTGTPVPTTVSSIVRANANPTNAATVQYTVTFAASVTGLTTANFNLTTTGGLGSTPNVSSVAGSGTTYTVTVNTGSGSGTLRLNLNNASGLTPGVSNVPYTSGEVYTIDKDGPAVTSVNVPANGTYRTGQTLSFVANFSENVTVMGTPQIALTIGSTTRQATYNSGSGTTALTFSYTVQSGDQDTDGIAVGALTLNSGTLRDALGNNATLTLNGVPSTAGILVDGVAPTVSSSNRQNPTGTSTSGTSVTFRVAFSEPVTGVTSNSFVLITTTGSTSSTGNSVAAVSGSNGTQYDVTVNGISGNGTIRLDVKSSGSGITDVAGNALSGGFSTGQTYDIVQTAAVTAVTGLTPTPTATSTVTYLVTFSGSVSGLTTDNFNLTTSGISGASVSSVSGSGSTRTVVVNTGTGDGTLRLNVATSTGVTPTLSGLPYSSGTQYTITKSFAAAPTLRIQAAGSASNDGDVTAFVDVVQVLNASNGSAVANALQNSSFETNNVATNNFLKTADGVVAAPWSFTGLAGVARTPSGFNVPTPPNGDAVALVQSAGDNNASLSQNLAVPTGSYQINFQTAQRNYTARDQRLNVFVNNVFVGNIQPVVYTSYEPFTSATFSVTAPALTATISSTAGASGSSTSTSPIPFAVSFSQSVGTTFTASDVTVTGGTLNSGSFAGSGSGPYTFTVTPGGNGTVSVSLAANVATDANNTGNTATATYSLNYTQPVTPAPTVVTPANGGFVTTATPTYTGTAPANATVTVIVDGSALSGTVTADGSGNWNLTQPTALSQGSHTVRATAQLSGQAVSASSATNTFTVDTVPPAMPVVATPANGSTTANTTPTYTGTAEANATVTVIVDGSSIGTAIANASGNWSQVQPSALAFGSHTVRATATDLAGNTSSSSNTNTFTVLNPATYTSSTADQASTALVAAGSTNQQILRVAVVIGGGNDNPLSAQSFSFTTNGSTNPADIAAARVYYTGTSGTFAATNQFGSAVTNPNGSFTITGTQQLATGTNYFFLVYDVAATAPSGNLLDATVPSLTVSGTAYTPSVINPAGNRRIANTSRVAGDALRTSAGYVDFSASPVPVLGSQYTQMAWIKRTGGSGSARYNVLGNGTSNSAAPFIYVTGNGRIAAGFGTSVGVQELLINSNIITQNDWHHVAVTYTGSLLTIYLDGVAQTPTLTPAAGAARIPASTPVNFVGSIGASGNTFPGDIDEVSQWTTALSQTQIRLLRHLTLRGTESNLASYLQFNDSGTTTTDVISGAVGTLTGATRTTSNAPVSFGVSDLKSVTTTGNYVFTGTNAAINFSSTSGTYDVVVSRLDGQPLGTQPAATGLQKTFTPAYWIVNRYSSNSFAANITYTLSPTDISPADATAFTNLKLFKRDSNSDGAFDAPISANAANAAAGTVTFPVTSFSQTVIGTFGTSPLPVTLLSFTAERTGDDALLRWTTAQEKNNAYFEVEASADGREFRSIGRVTGNGNSTSRHDYRLKDADLLRYGAGTVYYRLRQVDYDGTATLSDVVALAVTNELTVSAEAFPNPATDQLTVRLLGADAAQAQAWLYDAQGRLVQQIPASRSGADLRTSVQHLPSGVYTLRVQLPGRVLHRSVVISH